MVAYHTAFQNLFSVAHNLLKFQSRLEHKYLETELMTEFWSSSWSVVTSTLRLYKIQKTSFITAAIVLSDEDTSYHKDGS